MNALFYFSKLFKKLHGKAIKNSQIHPTSKVEAGSEIYNSHFGKYSFCGYYCVICNCNIGSYCSIANYVTIGGEMHPMDWVSTSPVFYEERDSIKKKFSKHKRQPALKTNIAHDVWIGERVLIKQGVNIGVGAVIGMGSVVTRDVKPYTIVAGSPAREINKRFDSNTIERLIASEWWLLDDISLSRVAMHVKEPKVFLKELEK